MGVRTFATGRRSGPRRLRGLLAGTHRLARLGRYGILSVASTVLGEGLIALFVGVFRWPAAVANLVAATIVLAPLYVATRLWVWRARGALGVPRQAATFWLISLTAVVLSTLCAGAAQDMARNLHLSHVATTGLVLAAVACCYGVLWLVRFFIFDTLVFTDRT